MGSEKVSRASKSHCKFLNKKSAKSAFLVILEAVSVFESSSGEDLWG